MRTQSDRGAQGVVHLSLSGNRPLQPPLSGIVKIRGGGPDRRSQMAHVDRPALRPRRDLVGACGPAVWTGQSYGSSSFPGALPWSNGIKHIASPAMLIRKADTFMPTFLIRIFLTAIIAMLTLVSNSILPTEERHSVRTLCIQSLGHILIDPTRSEPRSHECCPQVP